LLKEVVIVMFTGKKYKKSVFYWYVCSAKYNVYIIMNSTMKQLILFIIISFILIPHNIC